MLAFLALPIVDHNTNDYDDKADKTIMSENLGMYNTII
jgi:hypothetical protein